MKNESTEDRIIHLQKMFQASPNDVFLAYVLGLEYQKREDFLQAISCFEMAISLDPNYLAAYYQKALSLVEVSQKKIALETLELGIERAKALGDNKTLAEMNNLRMNMLIDLD